ncbi:hypothetical protein HU200_016963 [Digitaria exilis]|uniref:non-specific serine/threonine protein kinase n=1 Tax=Digitaria exilis TaxID=1010633 RepID=A0A835F7B5_9POAL|nr:hypothetical protein HU200_016963 [Digitaria exilis]
MKQINMLVAFLLLFFFASHPTAVAQISTLASPNFWKILNMEHVDAGGTSIFPVLENSSSSYRTFFGFYTRNGHSFILSIVFWGPQAPVIWSANPENPVSGDAILNFTREGDLLLQDGDRTISWSTETKNRLVSRMSLDVSGNLVLFDQNNYSLWQSFDHPTDTLVLGQALCRGQNLSATPSNTKWPDARIYFSAELDGLQYSFEPAAYIQLFQAITPPTYRTTTCYAFVNGSLGFPDKIFLLPLASSMQLMKLESDGHLRLYEMVMPNLELLMVLDVLSIAMNSCDYPLAWGDYGVCSNGQCSCPSLSYFRFQDERHPDAGCTPLTSISCDHVHDHQLMPLYNVS